MRSSPRRSGFTLIELLVVISIIAVLIGLLLPAVQMVRESSINSQCKNNLHQIGLALHQYHGANNTFPSGVNYNDPSREYWSWLAYILPYMEQANLWNVASTYAINTNSNVFSGGNPGEGEPMKCYVCPMDPRTVTQLMLVNGASLNVNGPIAFTEYLGNSGTISGSDDGVLYKNSLVRMTDVTDGTENTLIVGDSPAQRGPRFRLVVRR